MNEEKEKGLQHKDNLIRKREPNILHVLFFSNEKLKPKSSLYFVPLGTTQYTQFEEIDSNKSIFYARYQDYQNDKIAFQILRITQKAMNKFHQNGQVPMSNIVKGPDHVNWPRDPVFDGWSIPRDYTCFVLDFQNYSLTIAQIDTNNAAFANLHYQAVMHLILQDLLIKANNSWAPEEVIEVVICLETWFTRSMKLQSKSMKNTMQKVCAVQLSTFNLVNAFTWNEIAPCLTAMFILICIGQKNGTYISPQRLGYIYEIITDDKLGGKEIVLNSIKSLLGRYLSHVQEKLLDHVSFSDNAITKYHYILWYNLLNEIKPNKQLDNGLKRSLNDTKLLRSFQYLAELDMKLGLNNRPIPLETEFMSDINSISQQFTFGKTKSISQFGQSLIKLGSQILEISTNNHVQSEKMIKSLLPKIKKQPKSSNQLEINDDNKQNDIITNIEDTVETDKQSLSTIQNDLNEWKNEISTMTSIINDNDNDVSKYEESLVLIKKQELRLSTITSNMQIILQKRLTIQDQLEEFNTSFSNDQERNDEMIRSLAELNKHLGLKKKEFVSNYHQ